MKRLLLLTIVCAAYLAGVQAQEEAAQFKQPYPLGQKISPNKNFTGEVWLSLLTSNDSLNFPMSNVTFAPGCINSWHYHTKGQILIATAGCGYYQEKGKNARMLHQGDIVEVAPGTIHWHGAAPDTWFAHIAFLPDRKHNETVWLNSVGSDEYLRAVREVSDTLLTDRQKAIISIGVCTGNGNLDALRNALIDGLDAGMTINEINEILIQAYAYAGFPRSLRAIQTFQSLIAERISKGKKDKVGREVSAVQDGREKYERGREILERLSGVSADAPKAGYAVFAPTIERFLKEHLFCDIFERDLLSWQERELAIVSVIAGVGKVEPMAAGHMRICRHLGISNRQLSSLLDIVEARIGKVYAEPLRELIK